MDVRKLDFVADSESETSVKEVTCIVRPEWTPEKLTVRCLQGGVTNHLYSVRAESEDVSRTLLVRIFGEKSDLMIDRERERYYTSVLHQHGLAEPLHAVFNNGFVYGYVVGSPVTIHSLLNRDVYRKVGKELATMHSIPKPEGEVIPEAAVLINLCKWLEIVPATFSKESVTSRARDLGLTSKRSNLAAEVSLMCSQLRRAQSPLVMCHNDTTAGNILELEQQPDRVAFIDHEYAGWNLRCFDLGNMFCEFCGVDSMDFSWYPSQAVQEDFLEAYAAQAASLPATVGDVPSVKTLYREACLGALASNLHWGLWGIVQAEYSLIKFDFAEYANTRLNEYFKRKDEFLAIAFEQD